MSVRHLDALLSPSSIALVGASDRPGSLGAVVLHNLRTAGFRGRIWPVNRRIERIGDEPVWPDIAALPETPELAVICTPGAEVPELIEALGRRGTRAAIVLSGGLDARVCTDGPTLSQAMLDAARPNLMRILGPNSMGALAPAAGLNASFGTGPALPGRLAFISQSGALAAALLDWASGRGIGFSHVISLGDSADIDFGDLLDYLASDPHTRAILLYAESLKAGRKFMSAARAAARNKPVLIVKPGRAQADADAVFDAVVRRAGMLRVDALDDLFDAVETLAGARMPCGDRLAVLSNGGGAGALAADALALRGGCLAPLSAATRIALDACLPPTWSGTNPVDIVGDASPSRYRKALDILLAAPEVDGVLLMHAPTALVSAAEIAQSCLSALQETGKTVLTNWLGGPAVSQARRICREAGIPVFDLPQRAVAAWLQLTTHQHNQRQLQQLPAATAEEVRPPYQAARELLRQAADARLPWLGPAETTVVLQTYGIACEPPAGVDVSHAYELVAGVTTDPVFGPVVRLAPGGAEAAPRAARAAALPPLNAALAHELVTRSGCAAWLGRHDSPAAIDETALLQTLQSMARMACDLPLLAELDLAPLQVHTSGVWSPHARIRLHSAGANPPPPAIRPYPQSLEEIRSLGPRRLLLRPIRPEDGERLAAFYRHATPQDMRLRFFTVRREVPHSELARYSQIDYDREMALVALPDPPVTAATPLAGEARAVCDPDNEYAEFAIQIATEWQGQGLGRMLMDKLLDHLRARGTREVVGQCLVHNVGMASLARACGFEVTVERGSDTLALRRTLR